MSAMINVLKAIGTILGRSKDTRYYSISTSVLGGLKASSVVYENIEQFSDIPCNELEAERRCEA